MFYGTALIYWWPIVYPGKGRRRLSTALALPYLLPPLLEGMLIGVLLTFSSRPLYDTYAHLDARPVWGLSRLDDQQLGGLIMWVPACLVYVVAGLALFAGWLRESEARVNRWEKRIDASPQPAAPATSRPSEARLL